ncbi:hypothetical protein [Hoeflea alexandrii]|uniref:hypothetical protein n=1 Tax=Hoeflea alexandrii TaxID=288436 RepID=UPI0022B047D4|nr:hypothetical protein [Hoeflea alexandrii]MCZ4291278.1 hypothetical protein [Hoeflea alexandrii]
MRSRYLLFVLLPLIGGPSIASAALPKIGPADTAATQTHVSTLSVDVPAMGPRLALGGQGGYQVAQASALKFLRNVPTPRLRMPKPSAFPRLGSVTTALKAVPPPRPGALAKVGPKAASFNLLPKGLRKLPKPSYKKLTTAAARLRPNPRELMKDLAISGSMFALGIVPGEIIEQIYPVEDAAPVARTDTQ